VAMTIGKIAPAAVYEETRIWLRCADQPCAA